LLIDKLGIVERKTFELECSEFRPLRRLVMGVITVQIRTIPPRYHIAWLLDTGYEVRLYECTTLSCRMSAFEDQDKRSHTLAIPTEDLLLN